MVTFAKWTQDTSGRLYVSAPDSGEQGWIAYLLPTTGADPQISLADAVAKFPGSFFFASQLPKLDTEAATADFIKAVTPLLPAAPNRGLLWLTDPAPARIATGTVRVLTVDAGMANTTGGMSAPLAGGAGMLSLVLSGGIRLTWKDTTLQLSASNPTMIKFQGQMAPTIRVLLTASLPFAGLQRGCIAFDSLFMQRRSLVSNNNLRCGFQFVYPNPVTTDTQRNLAGWYPLLDQDQALNDYIGFHVSLDLTDIDNARCAQARTFLAFTGANFDKKRTVLYTTLRTRNGSAVQLTPVTAGGDQPARLAFHLGPQDGAVQAAFLVSPTGDYTLDVPDGAQAPGYDLLCGLSGTELIRFAPGDCMRFTAGQPAYAAAYPFRTASTVGRPVDVNGDVLKPDFRTSWATVRPASAANRYLAQPVGATLYGPPAENDASDGLVFRLRDTSVPMPAANPPFPLVPYAGVTPGADIGWFALDAYAQFEMQVVAPSRRHLIQGAPSLDAASGAEAAPPFDGRYQAATPAGLMVAMQGTQYASVLLAHPPSGAQDMRFGDLTPQLQQAMQTNQLFLVGANAQYLGALVPSAEQDPGIGPRFYNSVTIGDWTLAANVGEHNRYDDYSNVLIVKGRRGVKLTDLIQHPEAWTQAPELAAPSDLQDNPDGTSTLGPPNADEVVVLAQWLQTYVADAKAQLDPFFDRFKQLVDEPDWTGILVLKARVTSFPDQLKGLQGGMSDPAAFFAHHLGVDISPVSKELTPTQPSALFGLIYYVDPAYSPSMGLQAVAPAPGPYDFKLLTLKVLFANAAVQDFRSLAQLTVNEFFGQRVTSMGDETNIYNSILLQGSYQNHDGQSFYVLDTAADKGKLADNRFNFTSNVMNKVEVIKAQFNTVGTSAVGGKTTSRFDLWGFLDFKPLSLPVDSGNPTPFDLFSFGYADQPADTRRGLYYAGLAVTMTFPQDKPIDRQFTLDVSKISFDLAQSTPRASSLYQAFPLELDGIVTGDADSQPAALGFLPVGAGSNLAGLKGEWTGLRFHLNMGTVGALAGKAGLNAYLLLAWSPDEERNSTGSNYRVAVGISLPGTGGGAKLFSIQGVLRLSISNILLAYDPKAGAFVLTLTEIALKFLGMLKLPPNGATSLYLFGNGQVKDQASALGWYAIYK
ncbi:MAG: hypothetical protein JWN15_3488 [Firmicutes bacterium]|nr:hypothetical protein [Bacillota bacterium]